MGKDRLKIVEITGTLDSTPMRQRAIGFRESIEGDPRFEIVESVSGDFLRSKGKECMRSILQERGTDIDVLYSHNDAMTIGAIEAIEAVGLVPGKDIVIITVDGEQGAIDLLKEGRINCVVECTPKIGDIIMSLSKRLAAGESIERYTYSEETVFSEFDANLYEIPRGVLTCGAAFSAVQTLHWVGSRCRSCGAVFDADPGHRVDRHDDQLRPPVPLRDHADGPHLLAVAHHQRGPAGRDVVHRRRPGNLRAGQPVPHAGQGRSRDGFADGGGLGQPAGDDVAGTR